MPTRRPPFHIAWQPIARRRGGEPLAHEALLRPAGAPEASPARVLRLAERAHRIGDLERTMHRLIAQQLRAAGPDARAFVNLHATAVVAPWLVAPDSPLRPVAHQVMFELPAAAIALSPAGLRARVQHLRAVGFGIALTDLGSRRATLERAMVVRPDVIKLRPRDPRDPAREAWSTYAGRVLRFARERGAMVVAERVETAAQLRILRTIGLRCFQGHALGRPTVAPLATLQSRRLAEAS